MKKLIILILLTLPLLLKAQSSPEMGSLRYLDHKQSYKSIKLGSDISTLNSYYLLKLSDKPDASGCYVYTYSDPSTLIFGNGVLLKRIQLRVYSDLIASIYLFFEQSDGNKIKEVFTTAYGSVYSQKDKLTNQYVWIGNLADVYLTYEDPKLSAVIYSDTILSRLIKNSSESSASKAAADL